MFKNRMNVHDADTLGFLQSQLSHVESQVYAKQYPDIQYQNLVPVDLTANDWAASVTFYSSDAVGEAKFISGNGSDIPRVNLSRNQYQSEVHMAGIGYSYTLEEVNRARIMGINLPADDAIAARRAYEEFVDVALLSGKSEKSMSGLMNYPGISTSVAVNGAAGTATWSTKTADEVLLDVNNHLAGVWIDSLSVEMADTLLISDQAYVQLGNKRIPNTDVTLMRYIMENNIYTMRTKRPLTIQSVRGLATAGAGSTERMIAYRRDPEILKAHIPMLHQFLAMQIIGMEYITPGIFRFGGLDIRRPGSVRYLDGI